MYISKRHEKYSGQFIYVHGSDICLTTDYSTYSQL